MSDNEADTPKTPVPANNDEVPFTAKEEAALKTAWRCLKTAPDIDMAKFQELGGFNTLKTAQNTWGVIKKKLLASAGAVATTPKTGDKATPKKASAKKGTTTPRKRKVVAKVEESEDEGEARGLGRKKVKQEDSESVDVA